MELAKPIFSPMSTATPLSNTVGALQYLSITRLDITFAVNKVSQFASDPRDVHWFAIKLILKYLMHTIMYGLLIKPRLSSQLVVFFDVDWAGCPDDRKSTSGYCTFFCGNLLSWSSKK